MTSERVLRFECDGEPMLGILAESALDAQTGVVIVVGGPQYRVGCHRQFVLLARRLAERGIPVFRFDYRGMGDSPGEPRVFTDIDRDIAAAVTAFTAACPSVRRVVLWGLCDAASALLLYWRASGDERLGGLIMLNPWVLSDQALARSQLKHHFRKRLLEADFWRRLVRGQVSFTENLQVLLTARRGGEEGPQQESYRSDMAAALASFPGPVLLVLSGRDPTAQGFVDYAEEMGWRGLLERPGVTVHSMPDADHTFTSAELRAAVEGVTLDWIERHFRTGADIAVR